MQRARLHARLHVSQRKLELDDKKSYKTPRKIIAQNFDVSKTLLLDPSPKSSTIRCSLLRAIRFSNGHFPEKSFVLSNDLKGDVH